MSLDPESERRIAEPASTDAVREARLTPAEAVEHMRIRLPERGNRELRRLLVLQHAVCHALRLQTAPPKGLRGLAHEAIARRQRRLLRSLVNSQPGA